MSLFKAPIPTNEPVKSYSPGSAEKKEVKASLSIFSETTTEIRVRIGALAANGTKVENIVSPHQHKKVIAKCQKADAQDIKLAIKTATAAQREWSQLPWEHRASVFLKAADLLATRYRASMNAATMLGQSKTIHQAEIDAACELIDFFRFNVYFMQQIYETQPESSYGMWNRSQARGLEGFVLAITPFNFTSIAVNLPCAPALMGCSVLWKPALTSSLSSFWGLKVLEEAGLPPGVINFVPCDHEHISELALADKNLAGIHFTGSTNTFNFFWKKISENIANFCSYPRIVGETGGKDFVFAHESADTEELATALIRGAFEYQGQKCSAASRAYIPKSLWPKLKDQLTTQCDDIKMGDPADFSHFMGAVIDRKSFDRIKGYIDEADKSSSSKIIAGGKCDDREGYFIRPTIIECSDPHSKTMVEEIFGPVLSVYVYDNNKLDETLALCDSSTPYALTGAIFAKDRNVINKLSLNLENAAGNFYINDKPTGAVVGQQPFGGARASGTNDKAGSIYNLIRWTNFRTIKENFLSVRDYRYPFMSEP